MRELTVDNICFENIDFDEYWNLGDVKENKMHKIHTYPAKFPAFITQKALKYARDEKINVSKVADIFCGCGTVAYEAGKENIDFWGCDINPIAALIARVKSKKLDPIELDRLFNGIINQFNDNKSYHTINQINPRIEYWFYENEIFDLSLLKKCIEMSCEHQDEYEDFFKCAFSNILKPTSKWLTKSIKPQLDPSKVPANVLESFIEQYRFMSNANKKSEVKSNSNANINIGSSLEIKLRNEIDLIVTSPPYVTSYEYADLHQLSLLWLGYAYDYREFRNDTIGSSYSSEERDIAGLNLAGKEIVEPFLSVDRSKAKSITNYYLDMQKIAEVSYEMLTENGAALFVIGNTEYKGIHINNAKHLALSLFESGFNKVYATKRKITGKILTPYRDSQGRFTTNSSGRKVYSEEFIVVGRK